MIDYKFNDVDSLLLSMQDSSLNKLDYLRSAYILLREHYVNLNTIAGRLKARTMLLSTAKGRNEYGFTNEQVEEVFEDYARVNGYCILIEKSISLMQSISKNMIENPYEQ